jgi:hypothetical protein
MPPAKSIYSFPSTSTMVALLAVLIKAGVVLKGPWGILFSLRAKRSLFDFSIFHLLIISIFIGLKHAAAGPGVLFIVI